MKIQQKLLTIMMMIKMTVMKTTTIIVYVYQNTTKGNN